MSAPAWAVSLLIPFHLVAISLAAIPNPPNEIPLGPASRADADRISAAVTPGLARAAAWMARSQTVLLTLTRPVQVLTQPYVEGGLPQNWNMFSEPATIDRYVRLDFYVASGANPAAIFRELVLPSLHEDEARLSYSPVDKSVTRSVDSYLSALAEDAAAMSPEREAPSSSIAPLVRHFNARFRAGHGVTPEEIARTEIWIGSAPVPPPEAPGGLKNRQRRREILKKYRDREPDDAAQESKPLGSTHREADIIWQLVYVEWR